MFFKGEMETEPMQTETMQTEPMQTETMQTETMQTETKNDRSPEVEAELFFGISSPPDINDDSSPESNDVSPRYGSPPDENKEFSSSDELE